MRRTRNIQVGDHIGARYVVYRILGGEGRSGMGIVYVCLDLEYRDVVALKTFQDKYLTSREMKDSFRREALAWVHLERHPYIVRAIAVQELDSRLFILLEYVAPDEMGRNTLTHYLKSQISVQQASEWGIQFCHGMEHATSRGVTPHRDIKPDKIMVTSDGIVKITDFGLAGLWDGVEAIAGWREKSGEGHRGLSFLRAANGKAFAGTAPWMAPEQFDGEADVRSDIYSFGMVLYQMASDGKLPFHGMTGKEYYQLHRNAPVPELDSKLFPVIERCLRKDLERRWAGFQELRMELEGLYRKETGASPPSPPGELQLEAWEHNNKGLSLDNLGLCDEAISEYRAALSIDPDFAEVRSNLGVAFYAKGQLDEAISEFRAALNPDDAEVHSNLGNALVDKGQVDEAISEYRAALRIRR